MVDREVREELNKLHTLTIAVQEKIADALDTEESSVRPMLTVPIDESISELRHQYDAFLRVNSKCRQAASRG